MVELKNAISISHHQSGERNSASPNISYRPLETAHFVTKRDPVEGWSLRVSLREGPGSFMRASGPFCSLSWRICTNEYLSAAYKVHDVCNILRPSNSTTHPPSANTLRSYDSLSEECGSCLIYLHQHQYIVRISHSHRL